MRRTLIPLLVVVGLGCRDATVTDPGPTLSRLGGFGPPITVMTQNVYVGADLDPVIGAPSPEAIPGLAAAAWAQVQATDFPTRAERLAEQIAAKRPDLIGLQEAATFHIQQPGDAALGGTVPATTLVYDYASLLVDALAARGHDYRIVARTPTTQVELPVFTGASPIPFDDLRFTDGEVILAAAGVEVSNAAGGLFQAKLSLPIGGPGGPTIDLARGWASVDAKVGGETFRFLSTHLEVQAFAPVQDAQATELLAIAGASPHPIVLVGDFNSDADGSQTPTYQRILDAGYRDVWQPKPGGDTCCHAKDLANPAPSLDQRLDVVFVRGFGAGGFSGVVGSHADHKINGLWPSDHAGVAARVLLH